MMTVIQLSDYQAALFWNGATLLALILVLVFQWKEMKRLGVDLLTGFVIIAVFNTALLLGARLGSVSWDSWQAFLRGGESLYAPGKTVLAGILLALPVFWLFKKYWKLNGRHADAIFIALPLGAALIRVGCTMAGCCYGELSDGFLSLTYGPGMPAFEWQAEHGLIGRDALSSLPVYPVQLMVVLANLLLFALLWGLRKRLKVAGSMAFLAVGLLLLNRFWIEFFRDLSTDRGLLGGSFLDIKAVQWFSLLAGLLALFLFRRNEARGEKTTIIVGTKGSLAQIAAVLLTAVTGLLLFQETLSVGEVWVLLITFLPALGFLLRELVHTCALAPGTATSLTFGSWIITE